MRSCVWIMAVGLLLPAAIQSETQCRAQGTVPREEATPALKPHESVKRFKIPEDLDISVRVGWVKGLDRLYITVIIRLSASGIGIGTVFIGENRIICRQISAVRPFDSLSNFPGNRG